MIAYHVHVIKDVNNDNNASTESFNK